MILCAQSIRARNLISPFRERKEVHGMTYGLGPAGYDVRVAEEVWIAGGGFVLASTVERFTMDDDILGQVCDKSSWARRGLFVQNTIIEPGWKGYLTLELTYDDLTALEPLHIKAGSPIAQIIFMKLDMPTDIPYNGKYQNQGKGPQGAL